MKVTISDHAATSAGALELLPSSAVAGNGGSK